MASMSGANKIVLKGRYSEGGAEHEEGILKTAAYPGQNVVMRADTEQFGRHSFQPGGTDYVGTGTGITTTKAPIMVLKEDPLIGSTIDTQYAADVNVFIHKALPGEHLQVLVLSGQNIVKGEGLTANSDGKWIEDAANAAVMALEGSNGALAADTLMRVIVL